MDLNNPLLKNVQFTNLQQQPVINIQQHNVDYLKSLEVLSVNDKINAHMNVREKVFKNRNTPTMTLDDFADKQMAMMAEDKRIQKEFEEANKIPEGDEEKDIHVDNENRAEREWDDWKDLHEKGSGNKGYSR